MRTNAKTATLFGISRISATLAAAILAIHPDARASTNGDDFIGVDAVSRALGGNGVGAPQDVTSAISVNPAGMSFLAAEAEADVSLTIFVPHISATVGSASSRSKAKVYLVPSIGVSKPLGRKNSPWTYGFGVYALAGAGVNYNNSNLSGTLSGTAYPLVAGGYTQFQTLELAPSISYRILPQFSVGSSLDLDYGRLDLGGPTRTGFGVGVQPGVIYQLSDSVSFGVSYESPKPITYKHVVDLAGTGTLDNLELEAPQQLAFGGALKVPTTELTILADARLVSWGSAVGYKDFGWQNLWVFGGAVQYDVVPKTLVLRAGYTFGGDPLRTETGFNGTGVPANVTNVQGNLVNNYYYQSFRVVGFPAIVEKHLSFGFSYVLNSRSSLEVGYTHSFKNTLTESGLNLLGAPTTISSSLSEDSYELGYRYHF